MIEIAKIFQGQTGTRDPTLIGGYESSMFIMLIVIILWFLVGVLLSFWVWKDLQKREAQGIPYIIATLLGNIVGFTVYLFVRYNEKCALESNELACEASELEENED